MRLPSFIAFCFIILFCSCCKPEPEPIVRLIPAEMKQYWNFKPGSYWIYEDSTSGAIDSVYVTEHENYTFEGTLSYNEKTATCEYLGVEMHSSLDGYNYDYYINTQWASDNPLFNVASCSKAKPGDFVDNHICFVYPLHVGQWSFNSYGVGATDSCIIRNLYESYSGFQDVVQVDNTFNSFEHYKPTKAFYAKDVGLIRYEVPDSNKYRILIDYHIQH